MSKPVSEILFMIRPASGGVHEVAIVPLEAELLGQAVDRAMEVLGVSHLSDGYLESGEMIHGSTALAADYAGKTVHLFDREYRDSDALEFLRARGKL